MPKRDWGGGIKCESDIINEQLNNKGTIVLLQSKFDIFDTVP